MIDVGDLVYFNKDGFWRVIGKELTPNGNMTRCILEQVLSAIGKIPVKKPRTQTVFEIYCTKITKEDIEKFLSKDINKWQTLLQILEQQNVEPKLDIFSVFENK